MNKFFRRCGIALLLGGVVHILINVLLTPSYLASFEQGEAIARGSGIHLIRLSAAIVDLLLLLFGTIGLYLSQMRVSSKFGTVAFGASFVGTVLLIAVEWSNLFVLRAVAQTSPDTFSVLNKSSLMTAGFASGAGLFFLGWLLLSISLLLSNQFPRWAASSTIAVLILIPILGVTPLGIFGQVIGNVVFGSGLIGLGYFLAETAKQRVWVESIRVGESTHIAKGIAISIVPHAQPYPA